MSTVLPTQTDSNARSRTTAGGKENAKTTANAPHNDPALEKVDSQHGVDYARTKFNAAPRGKRAGLKFAAQFCPDDGRTPFATTEWDLRSATIKDETGHALFEQNDCEIPSSWSQLATNVVVSKYFYGDPNTEGERERSVRQLVHRVTRTISDWGLADGYFDTPEDGERFYRDLTWLCLHQHGAFNSPVWFNVGLHAQYGVTGSKCNWHWDATQQTTAQPENPYEFPQGSACFIQSVDDNMEDIMRLACSEAMLFKFGSGTGTDLSTIRSQREKLSGGGTPSGPLSFMRVYDSIAGVVKSGGKTRRAAKMQSLKVWHADILEFIECKWAEEKKAHALIREGYESNFNGEAYSSVCFQNANLSVRLTDDFMETVRQGEQWQTRWITDKPTNAAPKYDAKELLNKMAECAWHCGDPGVQYDTTINKWHTCPNSGAINASNPCSEYMFLDDTACNLSSINLMKFVGSDGNFDVERFRAAARTFFIAQEILVDHASYPTEPIARNSHLYRPLGLGYSNLGSVVMTSGLAYDSDAARGLCGSLTALLHGEANRTSAEMAAVVGPFEGYAGNEKPMNRVMQMHRDACDEINDDGPPELKAAATELWDEVTQIGEKYGFRNAQATVLAPTGTISFMMDCDTTGIEPDIALVKYKQLAGGGMLKIVNQTVKLGLKTLGYDQIAIDEILQYVDENDTIEGAPGLKDEHLSVFDCAFKPAGGIRSISWRAHITMMAAAQPFLSGAISKTVNMPTDVTPQDIADAYFWGWELGLKAIAIYRDGSKQSQPLNTKQNDSDGAAVVKIETKTIEKIVYKPSRERLPDTRQSLTHKFSIAGHEGYLCVGLYPDGRPGEIFITMAKEGSTIGGIMDSFGTALSIALQYGVPLDVIVNKFSHTRFEPMGHTTNKDIRIAKSVVDYIARWLGITFMSGHDHVAPASPGNGPEVATGSEVLTGVKVENGVAAPANRTASGGGQETNAVMRELKNDASAAVAIAERAIMMASMSGTNGSQSGAVEGNGAAEIHRGGQADQFSRFQTDAPSCDNCGSITVRNGNCYLCHNCGNSMGCS
ncbi:vitamin B12-dependent ribonucleotide reductase [Allorhodopirellula solitaria]|uniref:Vitamin B12-dependent ribonucleotide reductase n=1 Tax=Allorhodopirellula solitaria TaxID=2527987 RepID=A0A5C5YES8_9BACT|nr:vitamin B12-dependent ribonucleotide reductase [Allorhodopirellula solitaria]TWT74266.1 Vitamin B12-dependent ribonucleotide reductase [Allorhodopirellula solitaria]